MTIGKKPLDAKEPSVVFCLSYDVKCYSIFPHATSCMVRAGNKWPTLAK